MITDREEFWYTVGAATFVGMVILVSYVIG